MTVIEKPPPVTSKRSAESSTCRPAPPLRPPPEETSTYQAKKPHSNSSASLEKLAPEKSTHSERSSHSEGCAPPRRSSDLSAPSKQSCPTSDLQCGRSATLKTPGGSVSFQSKERESSSSAKQDSTKSVQAPRPPLQPKSILKRKPPPPPPYPPPTSSLAPPPLPPLSPPPNLTPPPLPPSAPPLAFSDTKTQPTSSSRPSDDNSESKSTCSTTYTKERKRSCSAESDSAKVSDPSPYNTSCYLSLSSVLEDLCLTSIANSSHNNNNIVKKVNVGPSNEKERKSSTSLPDELSSKVKSVHRVTDRRSHLASTHKTDRASSHATDERFHMPRAKKKHRSKRGEGTRDMESASSTSREHEVDDIATPPLDTGHNPGASKRAKNRKQFAKSKVDTNSASNQGGPKHSLHHSPKASFKQQKHKQPFKPKKKKVIIPGSPSFIPPEKTKAGMTFATRPSTKSVRAGSGSQTGKAPLTTAQLQTSSTSATTGNSPIAVPAITRSSKAAVSSPSVTTKAVTQTSNVVISVSSSVRTCSTSMTTATPGPMAHTSIANTSLSVQPTTVKTAAQLPVSDIVLSQSKSQSIIPQKSAVSTTTLAPVSMVSLPSSAKAAIVHTSMPTSTASTSTCISAPTSGRTSTTTPSVTVCSFAVQTSTAPSVTTTVAHDSSLSSVGEESFHTALSITPTKVSSSMSGTCTNTSVDPLPMEVDVTVKKEPLSPHSTVVPESSWSGPSKAQYSKPAPTETVNVNNKPLSCPNILTSLLTAGIPEQRSMHLQKSVSAVDDSSSLKEGVSQSTVDALPEIVEQKLGEISCQSVMPQSASSETRRLSAQTSTTDKQCEENLEESLQSLQKAVSREAEKLKRNPMSPAVPSSSAHRRRKGRVPVRRIVSELLADDEASDTDTSLQQPTLISACISSTLVSANVGSPRSSPVSTSPRLSTLLQSSADSANHHQSPTAPLARVGSPLSSAARTTPITSLALTRTSSSPLVSSSVRPSAISSSSASATCTTTAAGSPVVSVSPRTITTSNGSAATHAHTATTTTSVVSSSTVTVFTTEASTGQTLKVSSTILLELSSTTISVLPSIL